MSKDEQEIRQLVARWFEATKAGDTTTVLELMTDDVVFLRPGEPPMDKAGFKKIATRQTGQDSVKIEGSSEIQELRVLDSWAYMWTAITVSMTLSDGAEPIVRAGNALSILRKEGGKWLLARDANMLTPMHSKTPG